MPGATEMTVGVVSPLPPVNGCNSELGDESESRRGAEDLGAWRVYQGSIASPSLNGAESFCKKRRCDTGKKEGFRYLLTVPGAFRVGWVDAVLLQLQVCKVLAQRCRCRRRMARCVLSSWLTGCPSVCLAAVLGLEVRCFFFRVTAVSFLSSRSRCQK